ncbi:hypothetical protein U27_02163 [Candidatus Vecturithrix granuli]|uniref:YheO domain protein n=1 Tax=Vecturithrix granuli TaxID=1499967 RepID=A0A0S6WB12_VECG1|nr:hypothetical protein U27_02163 [Candidatus Vecturithrix granuli]
MNPLLQQYIPIMKAIAKMFGDDCEVVLHDAADPEHSIIAICNGHVTGRKVGDALNEVGRYLLTSDFFTDVEYVTNYQYKTIAGKKIKSSGIFLRDEQKKVVGLMCINYDLTFMEEAFKRMEQFCNVSKPTPEDQLNGNKHFFENLETLFDDVFNDAVKQTGRAISVLQKDDKYNIVKYLHQQGVFLVSGNIDLVAERLNVSKYTIYNYLADIKKK